MADGDEPSTIKDAEYEIELMRRLVVAWDSLTHLANMPASPEGEAWPVLIAAAKERRGQLAERIAGSQRWEKERSRSMYQLEEFVDLAEHPERDRPSGRSALEEWRREVKIRTLGDELLEEAAVLLGFDVDVLLRAIAEEGNNTKAGESGTIERWVGRVVRIAAGLQKEHDKSEEEFKTQLVGLITTSVG